MKNEGYLQMKIRDLNEKAELIEEKFNDCDKLNKELDKKIEIMDKKIEIIKEGTEYFDKTFIKFSKQMESQVYEIYQKNNKVLSGVFKKELGKISKNAQEGLELIEKSTHGRMDGIHKDVMLTITKILSVLEIKKLINEEDAKMIFGINDEMLKNLSYSELKRFLNKAKGGN